MSAEGFGTGRVGGVMIAAVLVAAFASMALLAGIGFGGGSIAAAQYQYGKVTICHHTRSHKHPFVTITISARALPAHLRHGDTIGPCAPPATRGNPAHGHHGDSDDNDNGSQGSTGSGSSGASGTAPGKSDDHGNGHN